MLVVVQSLSVWFFVTPWTAACQASLSFTISWSLLRPMSIDLVMPSNHLILSNRCPLFFLLSIFPRIRVSSSESAVCSRWPKYWSFSFSISLSNEYLGLIHACFFASTYCFEYCSFVIYLEIRKCDSSNFVLFVQNFIGLSLAFQGLLWFCMNFRIFFYFYVKCLWGFDRDCIRSVDHFE